MLARDYAAAKARFPALIQPKLDGVRMLVTRDLRMFSRQANRFVHLEHDGLAREVERVFAASRDLAVLDGELYVHGLGFQRLVSLARDAKAGDTGVLEYWVYDCVLRDRAAGFEERFGVALEAIGAAHVAGPGGLPRVRGVLTRAARSDREVRKMLADFERDGYEGVVVRDPGAAYQDGTRSPALLKLKTFEDREFRIVSVDEAAGKDAGTPVFVCDAGNERTFRARPVGTARERREMFAARGALVGKMLTVRFQGLTDAGVPRFPVAVAVRDYE